MLQAIIFDFDGVIVDSEPIHYAAFKAVLEPLGVRFDYGVYLERYAGFDDREGMRAILSDYNLGVDAARAEALIESKAEALTVIVAEGVKAMPGAAALIRACADRWPLAVCSGALRSDIELMLPAIDEGLAACFRHYITAEDVARSKPDPASYRLAADRLGVDAADCLAIEDTAAGIASAKTAGLKTLAVTHTYPADELAEADRIVETLVDLKPETLQRWFG